MEFKKERVLGRDKWIFMAHYLSLAPGCSLGLLKARIVGAPKTGYLPSSCSNAPGFYAFSYVF